MISFDIMNAIRIYIENLRELDHSSGALEFKWQSDAAETISISNAYKNKDAEALKELARDLIDANDATSRVAIKYLDIFHENVAHSRNEENKVYLQIIAALSGKALDR